MADIGKTGTEKVMVFYQLYEKDKGVRLLVHTVAHLFCLLGRSENKPAEI